MKTIKSKYTSEIEKQFSQQGYYSTEEYNKRKTDGLYDEARNKSRRVESFIKTCTWRVLATTDTFIISWLVTGTFEIAGAIAGIEIITKFSLYYLHERFYVRYRNWREEKST
ncbi:MAG: DUF2061 domain-containing protein [Candidatus Pacebacteria bacterium]|jgi:uncharacterized membrane protein|nr:DUF2061 domain-containing protein [Candidatus Paceibacterota bacterium]|tara:strand:+ start:2673 stop:3008 length:336 start_codon:yes stop_codon:yes gene_type:complete